MVRLGFQIWVLPHAVQLEGLLSIESLLLPLTLLPGLLLGHLLLQPLFLEALEMLLPGVKV